MRILSDESLIDDSLRELLRSATADSPRPEELAALSSSLASLDAGAPMAAGTSSASALAANAITALKIGGGLAVVAVGLWVAIRFVIDRNNLGEDLPSTTEQAQPAPTSPTSDQESGDEADTTENPPSEIPGSSAEKVVEPRLPARQLDQGEHVRSRVVLAEPPPAASTEPAQFGELAPENGETVEPEPSAAELTNEAALLLLARDALRQHSYDRALSLVRDHEHQYPTTGLAQERERIAIEAMARAGNLDGARARLAGFREQFPSSSYLNPLERLVR